MEVSNDYVKANACWCEKYSNEFRRKTTSLCNTPKHVSVVLLFLYKTINFNQPFVYS